MKDAPKIVCPGLVWRKRDYGWEARWMCRTDLIAKGFAPKSTMIWRGEWPTEVDAAVIQTRAGKIHAEMLAFSAGLRAPPVYAYDGTLRGLVSSYQTDVDSTYHKLRFHVRRNHDGVMKRIVAGHGTEPLADIKARTIIAWHKEWSADGEKIAMGHSFVTMLRTMFSFGKTILEDEQCKRLSDIMGGMKFPSSKPRTDRMTPEQAILIRIEAHKRGWHSIAFAQALQFELMFRQKDVIGEWVGMAEPGTSEVTYAGKKWLHGLRWSEMDDNLIVRHVTSKRGKAIEWNLRAAPMVLEELAFIGPDRPKVGPMLICEYTGRPWTAGEFRRKWRILADAAGIPEGVRNMDSRAGAITEASEAGADIEHIKHAATHSNIAMTQRYARATAEKIDNVQQHRLAHRNKPRTDKP